MLDWLGGWRLVVGTLKALAALKHHSDLERRGWADGNSAMASFTSRLKALAKKTRKLALFFTGCCGWYLLTRVFERR